LLISGITHLLLSSKKGSNDWRKSSAAERSHLDEKLREVLELRQLDSQVRAAALVQQLDL
jgi:hypothetical protein